MLGREQPDDLMMLDRRCHDIAHGRIAHGRAITQHGYMPNTRRRRSQADAQVAAVLWMGGAFVLGIIVLMATSH